VQLKKRLTIKILKSRTIHWKSIFQVLFFIFFLVSSQNIQSSVIVNSVTICTGSSATLTASGTGSYTWSTLETTTSISVNPVTTTTYTVTDNGDASIAIATVTVSQIPVATATPSSNTICSGSSHNDSIALISNLGGTTSFVWTTTAIHVNGANSGSIPAPGYIAQTLTSNPITVTGTATYTIIPKDGACTGSPITAHITVHPKPKVITNFASLGDEETICSGNPTGIQLTSSFAGTTFNWTVSQSNTSGASAGSGIDNVAINQTLYSDAVHGDSLGGGTTEYHIIPTANGCIGNPIDFDVIVNQTPIITNSPMSQTICSGHNTTLVKLTSDMVGTYYDWSATPHLPSLGGYDTIGSINNPYPPGAEMDTIPVQWIWNSSNVQKVVTYSITVNGCPGPITEYKVYVNPSPGLSNFPQQQTFCSGLTSNLVTLTSFAPSPTFSWFSYRYHSGGHVLNGTLSGRTNNGTSTIPAQTLTTTSTEPDTVRYDITITSPAYPGCNGGGSYYLIAKPLPDVISTPHTSDTICSDSTSFIELSSSLVANTTFAWTVNPSGLLGASNSPFPLVGNNDSIEQTLINNAFVADSAVYSIVGTSDGCTGPIYTDTVRVEPTPDVTTPPTVVICSDSATMILLTSHVAGTTYNWTVVPDPSLTGDFSPGSKDTIIRTLHNPTLAPLTAIYTITPTANGCPGLPYVITVTVDPTPNVVATNAADTICSDSTTLVVLTGGVAGITYSWAVTQSAFVSGAFAGSNDSIQQTLINTANTVGFASYTITPTANGCPGIPIIDTIFVHPTPVVTSTVTAQTICSDSITSIPLQSSVAGTTFDWTVDPSGVLLTATAGNGNIIAQTLHNATNIAQTAVYTIVPTASACPGAPFTVTVTVNPTPDVSAAPSTICSGDITNVTLTSPSGVVGILYTWTVVNQTGVSGASAGSSLTAITQTLTATGIVSGTATYSVTPTINGCRGTPITVIVTVKPAPIVTATNALDTICSGTTTNIVLSSNLPGPTFYSWTVSQVGVSGATTPGVNSPITQTLTATGVIAGTATYTIIPTANLCPGSPVIDIITVIPTPDVIATPAAQTICSSGATSIALSTNIAGTSYAWTVVQAGVSGASASAGSNITQTLTTTGPAAGTATYSITPTLNGCVGIPFVVVISVNPLAIAAIVPKTICSGSAPNILLTSPIPGTTFDWTQVQTNVSGARDSTNIPNNGFINQLLTATTTSAGTAVYTVTPSATGCAGLPVLVTVTVNPVPNVMATPTDTIICSGATPNIVLSSAVLGAVFDWTAVQIGMSGASAVNDTIGPIAQVLSATGIVAGTAVYTITPKINGCPGTVVTTTVTVNPISTATPTGQTICSGTAPNIILSSPVLGTTFNWTVVQNGVTGAYDTINSAVISQTLTLTGVTSGNAVYTITPSASGCAGTPINVVVTVNPFDNPSFNYSSSTFCKTGVNPSPIFIATIGGAFSATPAGLSLNAGTGAINLSTSTAAVYTVKYVTNGTCPDSTTFGITITNSPDAAFSYGTYCKNGVNPVPTFTVGSSAGVFTEPTGGLVFANKFTGLIDLTASAIGTYTVTNTIPPCSGGVPFVDSSTVTILPIDNATFNYSSSTFCKTGINPSPTFIATIGGTFSAAPAGLSLNAVTGAINLSTSTVAVYTVKYVTNGTCPDSTTFGITITNSPSAAFSYGTYCKNGINPVPTFTVVGSSAGVFTEPTGGLVFANKFTGLIDLTASAIGTYTVTNTIPPCSGGVPFVDSSTITILPIDNATFNYSSSTFCQSAPNPSPTMTGLAGGIFSAAPAGLSLNAVTGAINLSLSALNTYVITYTTNGTCPNTSTFIITISNASPIATFSYAGPYCKNDINPAPTPSPGASFGIFSEPIGGLVFANKFTGIIDLTASTPGTYTITNTIDCNGTPITAHNTVTINPLDDASFHYQYSTFCQAALINPTPTITGLPGGMFSASPAGIVFLSTSTGKINLSASAVGTYTVTYTNVGGTCPNSGTFIVNITALPSPGASFSYAGPYCQSSTPNASPTLSPGSFPGVFSASADLVFSDPFTGLIDLTASAQGTYTVTNTYDCSGIIIKDSNTVTITLFPSFTVPANTFICSGDSVVTTSFVNIPTYTWTNSNPAIGLAASGVGNVPGFIATNLTATSISGVVTVTSTLNGCVGSVSSYTITVQPTVKADAGADATIISGTSITLGGNPTGNVGSTYIWKPSAGFIDATFANPITNPASTTVYSVIVTSGGCTATDFVLVTVIQFMPPGGFTPNGDGANDTWVVDFLDYYPKNTVEIYNRWGEIIFQSTGYKIQWDGMFKGLPLPVGTYYYIINLNDPTFPDAYTGPVTIMR
jgi:gliding motility-associated-like protein